MARILVLHRQPSAVGYYRQWVKARALKRLGHEVVWWEGGTYHTNLKPKKGAVPSDTSIEEWLGTHLNDFDLLFVDREVRDKYLRFLTGFKHYSKGCRMVVDFDDDFTQIPEWNQSHGSYNPGQEIYETGLNHLRFAEMTTVSTQVLVERFKDRAHNIQLLSNYIDPLDWVGLPVNPERTQDDHIRVCYGGAAGHYGDLNDIRQELISVVENPPVPWRLLCFGALPDWMHELTIKHPGKVISLPWVPFQDYPQTVAWGGFDVSIAPLAPHPFNEAKSNIKWLEAAIQGIPFLCSTVGPYKEIPPGCAVRAENKTGEWGEALLSLLTDKDLREHIKETAREEVLANWTIDKGEKNLQIMVQEALSLPRIETLEDTRLPSDLPVERPLVVTPEGL